MTDQPGSSVDDLIARLKARAADPDRRVDFRQDSFSAGVTSLDLGSLMGMLSGAAADLRRVVANNQAGIVAPDLAAKASEIAEQMATPVAAHIPPPVDPALLAKVEAEIGFPLPAVLRRAYLEVADGAFGPHGGLLGLEEAAKILAGLRGGEELPRGRSWPDRLLPLVRVDPGYYCIDGSSPDGPIVAWNPEDLGESSGEKAWSRSFSPVSPSVEAWLTEWVGGRTQAEQHQDMMRKAMIDSVRQSRAYFAAMTPEQRASYGLPEVGWEKAIGGHLGLDDELD